MSPGPPDEKALRDLIAGGLALPAVLVAHELGLFSLLARGERGLEEITRELSLAPRPAEALLTACASLGWIERRGDRFAAGAFRPDALGAYFDLMLANEGLYTPSALRAALRGDAPPEHPDARDEAARTRAFTRAMHARGAPSAAVWPELVDLADARLLLDIGGGSGVHAIAAVRRWPALRAIVLDRPLVCEVARGCIADAGLAERIEVQPVELRDEAPFPPADAHFYSDVLHNASVEENRRLLARSRRSLAPGGRLLLHEMLLDEDRSGPGAVAAAGLLMLLWTRSGRQYTERALRELAHDAGFGAIETRAAGGYYSLLAARV